MGECAARHDAAGCKRAGERGGHYRRAPVRIAGISAILDCGERLEDVGHAVVEPRGEVREVLVVIVDEAVDPVLADADAVVEAFERGAATGGESGADRAKGIRRDERLILDGSARRLL